MRWIALYAYFINRIHFEFNIESKNLCRVQVEEENEYIGAHCTEACLRDGHTEFCSLGPHCTQVCLKEGHSDDCWLDIPASGKY